jgi:2'-5' RNA ligase
MATLRAFFCAELDGGLRGELDRITTALRQAPVKASWVKRENLHVTLKFLGEVEEDLLPELSAAVEESVAGTDPFDMALNGFGAFPSLRRPSVVWSGLEANDKLSGVQEKLERAVEGLGFPREDRPFRPHLTLGRTRKRARPAEFAGFAEAVETLKYQDTFRVRAVDVMRSRLMPGGALYDVLHSAGLGT